jgi:tetratricopeptide (TPR) repeat protein
MTVKCSKRSLSLSLAFGFIIAALAAVWIGGHLARGFLKNGYSDYIVVVPKKPQIKLVDASVFLTKPWSVSFIENRERDNAKLLLQQGQFESALSAAKAYYNIAELSKTQDAIKLMNTILTKARGRTVAAQWRREQNPVSNAGPNRAASVSRDPIYQTIKVNSAPFDAAIRQLEMAPEDYSSTISCGNLLLLMGKPAQAKSCFECALQIANAEAIENPQRTSAALEGIARSLRDEDGSARRADQFICSLRPGTPARSAPPGDSPAARICATSMRLTISGLFSTSPGQICQSPEDASAIAADDPQIASWLDQWQATGFNEKYVGGSRKSDLLTQLENSHLPCLTLLSIARAISFRSTDDWVMSAFYAAAATRGHDEMCKSALDPVKTRQILFGLYEAKPCIWRVVDSGDTTFVKSLYLLNCDLARLISPQDIKLQKARIHGFIGAAECLWLMGNDDDALKTVSSIEAGPLTIEERRGAAWIHGLVLLSMKRYPDAGVQFQIVASSPEYTNTESASRWLAVCLARSGKAADANKAFDSWIRRYRPDVRLAGRVLQLMDAEDRANQAGDERS